MCPHLSQLVETACGKYKCGKKLSVSLAQPTSNQEVHPRNLSCRQCLPSQPTIWLPSCPRSKILPQNCLIPQDHPSVSLIQHHHAVELMFKKTYQCIYIYINKHYIINDISYPNPHIQSIVNNPWEKTAPRNTCQGSQSIAATWVVNGWLGGQDLEWGTYISRDRALLSWWYPFSTLFLWDMLGCWRLPWI